MGMFVLVASCASSYLSKNEEKIKAFSGIDIIEDGQIKNLEAFTQVLKFAKDLAPAAREEFVSLFSERDTKSTILGLITQAGKLGITLEQLKDPLVAARLASEATGEFFEKAAFKGQSFENNVERLKAALTGLVKESNL